MVKQTQASDPVSQAMLAIEDALNLSTEAETPQAAEPVAAAPPPPPAPEFTPRRP